MKLSDFDFDLPEALIATRPARPRTGIPRNRGNGLLDPTKTRNSSGLPLCAPGLP